EGVQGQQGGVREGLPQAPAGAGREGGRQGAAEGVKLWRAAQGTRPGPGQRGADGAAGRAVPAAGRQQGGAEAGGRGAGEEGGPPAGVVCPGAATALRQRGGPGAADPGGGAGREIARGEGAEVAGKVTVRGQEVRRGGENLRTGA